MTASIAELKRRFGMASSMTASIAELKRRFGMASPVEDRLPGDAVVLFSGGLDSTTALAIARDRGFIPHLLTVSYSQRHRVEVTYAACAAMRLGLDQTIVDVPLGALARSALTRREIDVPKDTGLPPGVPATYVPARNTVLLGLALTHAESIGCRDIFVGFNVLDASGYPDCRPEFVRAFEALAQVATRPGLPWRIHAPLIHMTKAEIIRAGLALGVDYKQTHSCYDPDDDHACGRCDACVLRRRGFAEAGVEDPTLYA